VFTCCKKNGLIRQVSANDDNRSSQGESYLFGDAFNLLAEMNGSQGRKNSKSRVGQQVEALENLKLKTRNHVWVLSTSYWCRHWENRPQGDI